MRLACFALVALALPSMARAAPADVFFVLDTSASMNEPAGDGSETKLDVARALVLRLAEAAEAAGHRTALLRFRQRSVIVMGGEGPREVVTEADDQCVRAADVLVPLEAGAASAIATWVDGEGGQGVPEVEALGDSPLYGATRVAVRYVDGLRALDPLRHCVRALIVIVTDGGDTCAGGAELLATLEELEAAAPGQAIQTLVVAFDPSAEAAGHLARVGREEADPTVFTPSDAADLEARLAALDGRAVIESCGAAAMPMGELDAGPGGSGVDAGCELVEEEGGGCSVGAGRSASGGVFALIALALFARRRRGLLLAALLAACGDAPEPVCVAPDAGLDAAVVDAALEPPPDPDDAVRSLRARQAVVREAFVTARDAAAALVTPELVFDAIEGDPLAGCQALLDTVAYEAYSGAQRGVRGCLATRRCSSLDQSLLMQACLAHHGVTTSLRECRVGELGAARAELEMQVPAFPDVAPIDDALRAASSGALDDLPTVEDAVSRIADAMPELITTELVERAREDAAILTPLTRVDADASAAAADGELERAWERHFFLQGDTERVDPVLPTPSACTDIAVDLARESATMTVEVLVQNVDLTGVTFGYRPAVSLGTFEIPVPERWGDPVPVVITGAEASAAPEGLPPPAAAGCFRAFVDGTRTPSFPLLASDASACGGDVPAALLVGHGLGRVIVRTSMRESSGLAPRGEIDRVVVDRWGSARSVEEAVANGPVFSTDAARRLLPMRIELVTGAGLLGPHEELYRALEDRLARFDALVAPPLVRLGAPPPDVAALPAPDFATATFGLAREAFSALLPASATLRSAVPWRVAVVHRRVHVPGEGVVEKHIFDLVDVPLSVTGVDPAARLRASLELGAALTEAERLAGMALSGTFRVVSAATLLRDPSVDFAPWDSDPEHAAARFPLALQDAGRDRSRVEDLIVTPGAVEQLGSEVHAWWRIDPLGVGVGEVRYEGTLYGGVTGAKAVAAFTECLAIQAITALTGPRVAPDVSCCERVALRDAIIDLVSGFLTTVILGGLVVGLGSLGGEAAEDVADAAATGVTGGADIAGFLEEQEGEPECLATFEE